MKAREEAFERERAEYRSRLERERALRIRAEQAAEEARRRALLGGTQFEAPAQDQPVQEKPVEEAPAEAAAAQGGGQ